MMRPLARRLATRLPTPLLSARPHRPLLAARGRFQSELASSDQVTRWMQDSTLVDPGGILASARMWAMLKLLPGLDLPDFLAGSSLAYGAVTRLMYAQDWDALEPLVSEQMLNAMQSTMAELTGDGRRVMDVENDGAIAVHSAVLRQVLILQDDEQDPSIQPRAGRRCHLDVAFVSHETWTLMDYHSNETVEPYDGRMRVQESTWRFEGVVVPSSTDGGEAAVASDSDNGGDDEAAGWTVYAIV